MKKVEVLPTAKVSVKKSVLKKYQVKDEDVYFLKKDAEFEIELFNPTDETVMCKLVFNNKKENDEGLILYPGQRIFLERHLDTNKKLIFNTYIVEDTEETSQATRYNGLIQINFYKEKVWQNNYDWGYNTTLTCIPTTGTVIWGNGHAHTTNGGFVYNSSTNDAMLRGDIGVISDTVNCFTNISIEKETGRVGKGEKSNQAFINSYEVFNSYSFHTVKFRILPESTKLKTSEDFKHKKYCVECGAKVGTTDKFCSQCGTKI